MRRFGLYGTSAMRPDHGVRIELRLLPSEPRQLESAVESADRLGVSYSVACQGAEHDWQLEAILTGSDGQVSMNPMGEQQAAPEWVLKLVKGLLRALWRRHQEDGRYPRRITRWRAEPVGPRA
jgi:hypothetical protein